MNANISYNIKQLLIYDTDCDMVTNTLYIELLTSSSDILYNVSMSSYIMVILSKNKVILW